MVGSSRKSALDFYNSDQSDLYITGIFDWYRLPVDEDDTVLVASTSSTAATYWVIAYTILVTMIFMAACELATLLVLTFFRVGKSGTRHAMLIAYYNSGSPSRNLPIMLGYIYNGLFGCRRAGQWAVDWNSLQASFLLFTVALALLSGDIFTKFFLGGETLIKGNVAQANPRAVFYPDFGPGQLGPDNLVSEDVYDAFKGPRAPAVYQAIARKTSTGSTKLHADGRITYSESSTLLTNDTVQLMHWKFTYGYSISGYELGLRDAPGLVFAVDGRCETYHGSDGVDGQNVAVIQLDNWSSKVEELDRYPWWSSPNTTLESIVPLDRENYTAPWVSFQAQYDDRTREEDKLYGGFTFQLVPHTARRLSKSENPTDPWYLTRPNPHYVTGTDPDVVSPWSAPYRVGSRRPPMRCTQNDTYTYNGKTVNHVSKLGDLPGLKLSPLVDFVLQREFGVPVFAPILAYVPFGSLYSAVHFVSNQRRLDAQRASIAKDFRGLVEIGYVYSREVIRNTLLLFPSLQNQEDSDKIIYNVAASGSDYSTVDRNDADFLVDSQNVAALSVITLIVTPTLCVFLWAVVLSWTWFFTSQSKLDNKSASGRHALRRSVLQACNLYRCLDEELSKERKWSGRNTKAPYIRDLEKLSSSNEDSFDTEAGSDPKSDQAGRTQAEEVKSEYPKPKLVQVPAHIVNGGNAALEEGTGVWHWVKRNIFRMGRAVTVEYEVTLTKAWDPEIPAVPRANILEDL